MATSSIFHACNLGGYRNTSMVGIHWRRKRISACHLPLVSNNHNASSFTYTISDDVPLIELPGASFDQYMEDKGRVIRAIIPEGATTQHLIQEDWRIKMPTVQALFQKVQPVIDVRLKCKSNGEDYPSHVPPHVTKLFQSSLTKWEIEGVHGDYMPPYLKLEATGMLYPERKGRLSFIKNELKLHISVVFPPLVLAFVPKHVLHNIFDSACFDQYMEDKGRVIRSIIPEKATLKRLNQEVWRIRMPVMEALFLRVEPVIDVRVRTKSNGENYPSHIPPHITKLFEAHTIITKVVEDIKRGYTVRLLSDYRSFQRSKSKN
ncbi:DUF1997 family protein [Senna tora]|uniref:DUF1997 family protein n=1 Tax=Senna tora TaxID=362788 RepID=A0A834SL38_9FABA|nr:DUF1997 family protein [Senna tora]